uniref:Uncharacterized protein n=1 Tax=Caenorhabditis japonica TaxID=281687 RepID=A0A8R1E1N7_CAEJA
MVSRLTKAMGALSQNDEEPTQERRKSARLNSKNPEMSPPSAKTPDAESVTDGHVHDSGTESDEEELCTITSHQRYDGPLHGFRQYDDYLQSNPPRVSASPAWKRDVDDTESWDSFGRESGIMTGDNDSDTDGVATPTPARRRLRADEDGSPSAGKRGHEDSNPMADHPIAWRLRSFNFPAAERAVKVPVRRIPVHVLINRPPVPSAYRFDVVDSEIEAVELMPPAPAPKRGRRNSHRPSLDFEKMVQTRIEEPASSSSTSGPVTRSQINQ